jgi:hypothetical protein
VTEPVDPYGASEENIQPLIDYTAGLAEAGLGFIPFASGELDQYVGVPLGYRAPAGFTTPPVTAPRFTGTEPTPQAQFTKPNYTYQHLASYAGAEPSRVASIQMRLYNMGLLSGGSFMLGIFDETTHDSLEEAMTIANANGYTLGEMEDILKEGKKTAQQMGWTSDGGGSGSTASYSPYTTTQTSTTVSTSENIALTGRGGARALLVQALANEIGREPTKKEVTRFLRSLNAAERKNPSTTKSTTKSTSTTTTDPSPSGDTSVTQNTETDTKNVTRQSDLDPGQKAIQWARQHGGNEAKRFQAANFFSVIESMVGL